MKLLLLLALGAVLSTRLVAQAAGARPPATRVEPVTETLHGVELTDEYRWLEGDNADPEHMGEVTPEVAAWTDAQDAYTRSVLDALPGRKALEERLRPLMEVATVSAPQVRNGRFFFSKREGSQNQPVHYWREGRDGADHVLLDPATLDPSGLTTVDWVSPSHDGRLVAWGSYRAGDENTTLRLMAVDTGAALPDVIPDKVQAPDWLPDGSGFLYRNLADPRDPYSGRVRFHRLGTPVADDPVLFRQATREEDEKLATTWGPGGSLSHDGRWLVLTYWTSTRSNDLWAADFAGWLETGRLEKWPISVGNEGTAFGFTVGDTLYVQTNQGSPNGRLDAWDLRRGLAATPRPVLAERKDAVLEGVSRGRDRLAAAYLRNACSEIEVFDLEGRPQGAIALPGLGSASLAAEPDRSEAFLVFASFNSPRTIFRVDLADPAAAPVVWARPPVPVDPSLVEVEQVWYASKDGTRVSMFLAHRKGLERGGDNPTILTGYGGFNIAQTPSFIATLFPWFEAGGVLALPNLRGGGEYGDAWHEAGMLGNKQNVFDDFLAAAEWLVANRWTNPSRLAISGGSNGGLLTGAALVQRPDLFGAVIIAVPLLDMLRYQDFLMARYWVPEYGSAEDPAAFGWLHRYSPYHHVVPGTRYPAVLLTAGENDRRVHASHARKMAAKLQAATASDPATQPILLWVDREAGHGQGKPLDLRLRDVVDQRIFLMWQLGMLAAGG